MRLTVHECTPLEVSICQRRFSLHLVLLTYQRTPQKPFKPDYLRGSADTTAVAEKMREVMNSVRIRIGRSNVVRRTSTSISRPSRLHSVLPRQALSSPPTFLQRDNRQYSAPVLGNSTTSVGLGPSDRESARHDTRPTISPAVSVSRQRRVTASPCCPDWQNECDRRSSIDRMTCIWLQPLYWCINIDWKAVEMYSQLENMGTANELQLGSRTTRQSLPALLTTPMPSLKSLNLSTGVLQRFYCSYLTLRCDLDLWSCDLDLCHLTLNLRSVLPVTWRNSVPNLSAIEQSVMELLRFEYLTLRPWTRMMCYAMLWDSLNKV